MGVIFGLLGRVPAWAWIAAALVAWGWSGHARYGALKKDVVEQTAKSEKEQRDEDLRRREAQARAMDKAQADAEAARSDADRARAAEQRLRNQLAKSRAGSAPSVGATDAVGSPPADTYRELFGDCVARYRELGEEADRHRVAGLACERAYEALNPEGDNRD